MARRGTAVRPAGQARRRTRGAQERYVVGLDVGTSKVAAIVGEMLDDGSLDVVGIGESHGIRRGVVTNLEAAVESIKKAIEEAELTAGVEIDMVHLAVAGPHIKGFNSRGVIAVAGKSARSRATTCAAQSTRRRLSRCRTAARSSTCCRRTSWWTSRTASARPSG